MAKGDEASTEAKGKEAATAENLPSQKSKLLVGWLLFLLVLVVVIIIFIILVVVVLMLLHDFSNLFISI